MTRQRIPLIMIAAVLVHAAPARAEVEFEGVVEKRPAGTAGTWVIGGREVLATPQTKLDEDDGALTVGACAEVEFDRNGAVREIETEESSKCAAKPPAAPK